MGWWLFPPPQPLICYSWIFWNYLLYVTLLLSNLWLFHVPNSISWLIWKGRCQKKMSAHSVKLLTGSCLFRSRFNFNLNYLMQRYFTKSELTQTSCLLNEWCGDWAPAVFLHSTSTFSAAEWQNMHFCELSNVFSFVLSDSLHWISRGTDDMVTSVLIFESHELICKKQKLFQYCLPRFCSCEYWNLNNT